MDSKTFLLAIIAVGTVGALPTIQLDTLLSFSHHNGSHLGIYDGRETTIEEHPYQCGIFEESTKKYICSCTIIDKEWMMTTADCLLGRTKDMFYIVAGATDGRNGTKVKIADIIQHPNYGQVRLDYDITLVRVEKPFNYTQKVGPAMVPKNRPKGETKVQVSGWQINSENGTGSHSWKYEEGDMFLQSIKSCKRFFKETCLTYTNRMACAYNAGKTTLCKGDWADPIVTSAIVNGTKVHVVYGMFTAGLSLGMCTNQSKPVVHVAISGVSDWIRNTTGIKLYEV